jgi:hypothetical protein
LNKALIFDFDAGQRILTDEWVIDIYFQLAGTLSFRFNPDKVLVDVLWFNL